MTFSFPAWLLLLAALTLALNTTEVRTLKHRVQAHLHAQDQEVNRHQLQQQLGESTPNVPDFIRRLHLTTLELPKEAWENSPWQDSFVIYSALRDPVSKLISIFFDAEIWTQPHVEHCHFLHGTLPERAREPAPGEVKINGTLRHLGLSHRRFGGFSLTCNDPGPEFDTVLFRSTDGMTYNTMLKAAKIETIGLGKKAVVGACLAPMYSHTEPPISHWISDTLSVGVSGIDIYYTDRKLKANELGVNGVRYPYLDEPFKPYRHPDVTYYYYLPPQHTDRFYFGQTTALNDCIFRNRRKYDFIVVADADEYLTVNMPNVTLEALLEELIPHDHASVMLEALLYPASCQSQSDTHIFEHQVKSVRESAHFFDNNFEKFRGPKSIVRPTSVWVHDIHRVTAAADGVKLNNSVDRRMVYFKHFQGKPGLCSEDTKEVLLDDRTPDIFSKSYNSAPELLD